MIWPVYKSGKTHFNATHAATDDDGDAGSFHLCCPHPGHGKCSFCKCSVCLKVNYVYVVV